MRVLQERKLLQLRSIRVRYLRSPNPTIYIVLNLTTKKTLRCRAADFSLIIHSLASASSDSDKPQTMHAGSRRHSPRRLARPPTSNILPLLMPINFAASQKGISADSASTRVNATHAPQTFTDPKHIGSARRLQDATEWSKFHDSCIDRNISLGAWKPVPIKDIDPSQLVTPM